MSRYPRHTGVIVPLVTPVTPEGQLADAGAERLVDHVASHGCGLLLLGTTGEVASLSTHLRRRYVELAVRVAAKRVPVFACVAHNSFDETVALARWHLADGADAVVGMLPNYFKLEPSDMLRYYEQLSDAVSGPLYLYNMPATTGMSLPLDVVDTLSARTNIVGMKDSENTPGRREEVARRFAGRSDFSIFMGVAAHSVAALRLGFDGCVPSSGNLRPDLWRDLYAAAHVGDWTLAESLQRRADAVGAVFQRNRTLGPSLAALKASLAGRGLCPADMLPPLRALPPEEQAAVVAEVSRLP